MIKMKAVMIRVGIDSDKDNGAWNARCNPENGDFVYVPVPGEEQYQDSILDGHYANIITPALERFSAKNNYHISLPDRVMRRSAHLNPDFRVGYLSYGDTCKNYGNEYNSKGKALLNWHLVIL